jgi:hypothetical protein
MTPILKEVSSKRGPKRKTLPPRRTTTVRAPAELMDELAEAGFTHSEAYLLGMNILLGKEIHN